MRQWYLGSRQMSLGDVMSEGGADGQNDSSYWAKRIAEASGLAY